MTTDATASLESHVSGDPKAANELLPFIYEELRKLAARYVRREQPGISLQPTELVHEAYLRLIDISRIDWKGKSHFYAMAAVQMRRLLIERARRARAQKRGGGARRRSLHDDAALVPGASVEVLALDEALVRFANRHARQARVAELRLFAGMTVKEVAHVLDVSEATVKNDWRFARAWLSRALG